MSTQINLLSLIFLTLGTTCLAQEDPRILEIRKHFQYTENLSPLTCTTSHTTEGSTDGGTIKKCFYKGQLIKLEMEFFGETGKLLRTLYVKEGQLLFVFDQGSRYNMPHYIDDARAKELGFEKGYDPAQTKNYEERFYFYQGELIRWIDEEGVIQSKSTELWTEKETFYLQEWNDLKP